MRREANLPAAFASKKGRRENVRKHLAKFLKRFMLERYGKRMDALY